MLHVRGRRTVTGLGIVALLLAACGADGVDMRIGAGGDPTPSLATTEVDSFPVPAAGGPIFSWTSLCYGTCMTPDPPGLPRLVVYADGSVVRAETVVESGRDGMVASPATIEVFGGRAPMADLVGVAEAMAQLGAVDGASVRTPCEVSEGHEILDVDTPIASGRVVTFLLDEPPFCSDRSVRDAEVAIREALGKLEAAATVPYAPGVLGWVMLANAPQTTSDVALPTWPGPDPSTLESDGAYGQRCVELTTADLDAFGDPTAIPGGQMGARHYVVGASTWRIWLRPMLPHEGDCRGVRATIVALNEQAVHVE